MIRRAHDPEYDPVLREVALRAEQRVQPRRVEEADLGQVRDDAAGAVGGEAERLREVGRRDHVDLADHIDDHRVAPTRRPDLEGRIGHDAVSLNNSCTADGTSSCPKPRRLSPGGCSTVVHVHARVEPA